MANNNKALTVSYGMLSCTFKGFDDPMSAMRDIINHFKDVGTDAPPYGFEVPMENAQVLHFVAGPKHGQHVEITGVELRTTSTDTKADANETQSDITRATHVEAQNQSSPPPGDALSDQDTAANTATDTDKDTEPSKLQNRRTALSDNDLKLLRLAERAIRPASNNDEDPVSNIANLGPSSIDPRVTEDSVARLLSTAQREMEDNNSARRRNSIRHIKAAVAVTRSEANTEASDNATCSDASRKSPPLILEPKHNISAANSPATRRHNNTPAAHKDLDVAGGGRKANFSGFAAAMDAKSIDDTVEAAATYLRFVEGRSSVASTEIIQLASMVLPDTLPREKFLSALGKLVRIGHLNRRDDGQFCVADTSRFRPKDSQ